MPGAILTAGEEQRTVALSWMAKNVAGTSIPLSNNAEIINIKIRPDFSTNPMLWALF